VIEELKGERWEAFRDRHGDWRRDVVLYLGRRECGLKLRLLGQAVGGLDYAAVSLAIQRMEQRLGEDKRLMKTMNKAKAELKILNI